MKLVFRERKRKKTNRQSLEKVIDSVLKHFLTDEDLKDVKLEVVLKPFYDDGNGYVEDNEAYIIPYGKYPLHKFSIYINNKFKIWKIKQCLRHELIHLKQIMKGELDCWGDNYSYWLGKQVDPDIDHWSLPWEIEAYNLENKRF